MRALLPNERWALSVLSGPPTKFDALEPEGARLDEAMHTLIERGCVAWKRWSDDNGTSFGLTELGKIASRLLVLGGSQ